MSRFPPLPPEPPEPPMPRRSPWLPEPRPVSPGPVWASASLVMGGPDWLAQRLLDQRLVALAGALDADTANQAVGELALLDASGDDPVRLRLSGVTADLDVALTLVDALDLMSAPVHATALGTSGGAAVALLAVADVRTAGPHTTVHLHEPPSPVGVPGPELETAAAEHIRRVRRLQERLAAACRRPVDVIAADMRPGRVFDAEEARGYGLVDIVGTGRRSASRTRGWPCRWTSPARAPPSGRWSPTAVEAMADERVLRFRDLGELRSIEAPDSPITSEELEGWPRAPDELRHLLSGCTGLAGRPTGPELVRDAVRALGEAGSFSAEVTQEMSSERQAITRHENPVTQEDLGG